MGTREEATEARERLAAAVEKLADSDTFAAWLRARAAFHDYSFGNICLIVSQNPAASRVAGYRTWQKLGRQVRKGEKGIRILAPCRVKLAEWEGLEGERGSAFRVVGFRCVSVFDLQQTEGEPLAALEYRPLEGDAPDLADFLCGVAIAAGLEIRRESLSGGVHGYLRRSENLIVVDTACSGAMAAKVVAHELGHFCDPWLTENPDAYAAHRGDCEAVAESVAYVVCAAYGIDAGSSAVGYVASWTDGDAAKVRDLAERIDSAAAAILGRGKSTDVAEEVAA
jgi:antirestriction protein ArdC